MIPMMLGKTNEHIYAVFYPSENTKGSRSALLMCPPSPQESQRVWWLYGSIGGRFAQMGCPGLRFDYAGTGDSFGDSDEFGPRRCQQDIAHAAHALLHMTGARKLIFFGTRFGALLLATIPKALLPDVRIEFIFLDPILDGSAYIQEMQVRQQRRVDGLRYQVEKYLSQQNPELLGYPLSDQMNSEYSNLSLSNPTLDAGAVVNTVITERTLQTTLYENLMTKLNRRNSVNLIEETISWNDSGELERVIFSSKLVDSIATYFEVAT